MTASDRDRAGLLIHQIATQSVVFIMWDGHGKSHSRDCPGERAMMIVNMQGRESCLRVVQSPPQLASGWWDCQTDVQCPGREHSRTLLATEQQQVAQGSRAGVNLAPQDLAPVISFLSTHLTKAVC